MCRILIVVGLIAFAIPASAGAVQLRGVVLHPEGSDKSSAVIEQEFAMLQAAGATSIRFDVPWYAVEWNGKGNYDPPTLRWLDWVFSEAAAHGLKVVMDVVGTPCWASSAPLSIKQGCSSGWWSRGVTNYPPAHLHDYADFVAFAASRWRWALAAVELWNEPNGGQYWISSHPARDYAALVRAAYPASKQVAPTRPVLIDIAGTDTGFLGELYYSGVRGFYDGVAVHPYNDLQLSGLKAFHWYQLRFGDPTPLWITEVGWSSADVGLQAEADDDSSMLEQLAALPYVSAAEIYDMRDSSSASSDASNYFGLIDYNLNAKPAWNEFVSELQTLSTAGTASLRRSAWRQLLP